MRFLAILFGCLSVLICGCDKKSAEYRNAYAEGVVEAKSEISSNAPTLYVVGKGNGPLSSVKADKETGLPLKRIAGCLVGDADKGRQDGHNQTILEHLKKDAP